MKPLRVLIIAPLFLPIVPEQKYGGIERVIFALAEQLSRRDVDVTVAATGDSDLAGNGTLIWRHKQSLWSLTERDVERDIVGSDEAREQHFEFCVRYVLEHEIDVIHDHAGLIGSQTYERRKNELQVPIVTTLHSKVTDDDRLNYAALRQAQIEHRPLYFVAISENQRKHFQESTALQIIDVVYNGISVEKMPFVGRVDKQEFLFWIGRISYDKGTDLAIKLAKAARRGLIIAGEVHAPDKEFYKKRVRPHITESAKGRTPEERERSADELIDMLVRRNKIIKGGEVLYLGPLNTRQKMEIYSRADALVMLNRWREPFGLVMPEAMAAGTPVIGTQRGAIPEIVLDGVTGFVLPIEWEDEGRERLDEKKLVAQAAETLERLPQINPIDCRRRAEKHFSADVMAQGYLNIYRIAAGKKDGSIEDDTREPGAVQRRAPSFS